MENVLVVGAGALGCEILSILLRSISAGSAITIVDPDTIELSNLSRQLLYRREHIGRNKAQVACQILARQHPQFRLKAHCVGVEEMSWRELTSATLIFSAVDQIKTRLWLNALVLEDAGMRPGLMSVRLIDVGTEGWMGHVRLVLPGQTSCLYCTKELYHETTDLVSRLPLCTLAGKPSRAEHCVGWALSLGWPQTRKVEFDPAKPDHLDHLLQLARSYGHSHNIVISRDDLRQVLHLLLPNILSTTTMTAALAVLVAIHGPCSPSDNTFWFINGQQGLHWTSIPLYPSEDCHLCYRRRHRQWSSPKGASVSPACKGRP